NTTTAFLCLGSLGDCLPLCALAASLPSHVHSRHDPNRVDERRRHGGDKDRLSRLPEVARCGATGDDGADCPNETVSLDTMRCVLVTHRCHSDLLRGLMTDVYDVAQSPEICPVDIPILFSSSLGRSRTDADTSTTPETNDASGGGNEETSSCLAGGEEDGVSRELDVCMDVLRSVRPKALIFNLYSSFGYHLADALGIPCACASPGVPPSLGGGVPLGRVLPRVLLKRLMDEGRPDTDAGKGTEADLDLWMLPLFQPRYRRWRLARGLYARTALSLAALSIFTMRSLPSAPLAMFGVSPAVLPRPGYWPPKADVYGFWSFAKLSRRYRAPEMLERFLERCNSVRRPIFCVGLGSMPGLGLAQDPNEILSMAVRCLLEAGAGVVLLPTPSYEVGNSGGDGHERINIIDSVGVDSAAARVDSAAVGLNSATVGFNSAAAGLNSATAGFNSAAAGFISAAAGFNSASTGFNSAAADFDSAAAAASVTAADGNVYPSHIGDSVFVPHSWLLPRCRGIVHHGGSGTVGAALRAGAVQAVIPFAFDQFFFADQVEHMGAGVRVPGTRPP
ncbi:unnamed protein product, partial [Ascophyllum nodosum]